MSPVDDFSDALKIRLGEYLDDLREYRMPFGRFGPQKMPPDGVPLYDLPLEYLSWFAEKGGFPRGRLGELMRFVFEVKFNGAEEIFLPLRKAAGGRHPLRSTPAWKLRDEYARRHQQSEND